jgi:transposase
LQGIDTVIAPYYHAVDSFEGSDPMRGPDEQTADMFSYLSPEARVRADHPLRAIRQMTDQVLGELSPRFDRMYSDIGRPSIPPEQLLRALLLQGLYTIRSERLLMEEIDYSILFRWFIGLGLDEPIWSPTTFSKNRDRLLQADVASAFFDVVVQQAREADLMSDEHFTVDGTVLASTTDPDAQLYRKGPGKEAKLAYLGHVLLDNRHGLVANVCATAATGTGEWDAAVLMLEHAPRATTVGGDKLFDVSRFVTPTRQLGITPHVAQKATGSRIDGRTTRHPGYAISQRKRKLIEQVFGWMKTIGGLRKLRHRGGELVDWVLTFTAAAYNLVRLRTLLARPA